MKIEINLNKKSAVIFMCILFVFGGFIFVYAVTPGTAPNPGHLISDLAPPTGCVSGQALKWNGANIVCGENVSVLKGVKNYYVNADEDDYGAAVDTKRDAQACEDELYQNDCAKSLDRYVCKASESRTCKDYYVNGNKCYYRDVSCKKLGVLGRAE